MSQNERASQLTAEENRKRRLHRKTVAEHYLDTRVAKAGGTMTSKLITAFRGPNRFLSNFHESPVEFNSVIYPTAEHAYQCQKTDDPSQRDWILASTTPLTAKRRGRKVARRADWDTICLDMMESVLRAKFASPDLAAKLLATGERELIEGNTWGDTFWGMVKGADDKWMGDNHLGRVLTKIRADLNATASSSSGSQVGEAVSEEPPARAKRGGFARLAYVKKCRKIDMEARYARCQHNTTQWASVSALRENPDATRSIWTIQTPFGERQIIVLSAKQAAIQTFDVPFVNIVFGNPNSKRLSLKPSTNRLGAHYLRCYDIEAEFEDILRMTVEQADALWRFVVMHQEKAVLWVVNCEKGLCRSPAAAAAIARHLGGAEHASPFFIAYLPNQHIYDLMIFRMP